MPRPRAFDVDEALQQAMLAFWRHGYRGTSVRQLCDAMGVQSGSFYASFGSKAELFLSILQRYLAALDLGPPGPDALRAYLDRVVAERDPTGCLLVASALERDALEPDAQALVDRAIVGLRRFLAESRPGTDPDVLLAGVIGLQVLHRAGAARGELEKVADRLAIE